MAEERRRRRRGRRRGRGDHSPSRPEEEGQQEEQLDASDEEEEREESGSRFKLPFGRRRDEDDEEEVDEEEEDDEGEAPTSRRREERAGHRAPAGVSPLSFWRRGRARTYREQPMPQQTLGRTLRRVRRMYFPPWVPVLFIVVVVFGILGALFIVRGAAGKPRIGQDHWHSTYSIFICGQRQPNFPTWNAGVHTHGDGVIHIHPNLPQEEGSGARLVKWFEYGGGKLSQNEMRMVADDKEYKNGDTCPDGSEGTLQVFVNGEKLGNWSRYIPQDGDRVRIVFGPVETTPVELEDRTVIAPEDATRTEALEITGGEADIAFSPASIDIRAGEIVRLDVTNSGPISHSVRVAGTDGEYNTSDDYVSEPEFIQPGESGIVVVRFDSEGEFQFQDPSSPAAVGTFVVTGVPEETPEPGSDETPVAADVTLDLAVTDDSFEPVQLEVNAGETFLINLTNNSEFVHNLRIAGPDGEFDTEDDLKSTPDNPKAGEDSSLSGKLDAPGTYDFRDDFNSTVLTGTITVK